MKTYKVKFLTSAGIVELIISESQDLNKLTWEMTNKYGQFITLSSVEI